MREAELRVLYVSPVSNIKGGAEIVLMDMLRSPLVRPVLAVPGAGDLATFAVTHGIPVHQFDLGAIAAVRRPVRIANLNRAARDAVCLAWRLGEIAHSANADVVHTNGLKTHVVGCIARQLRGTPTFVHMHDVPYSFSERLIWSALSRMAAHTIAGSEICFAGAARRRARISVVMQGVDTPPALLPRRLSQCPVIGFLGRLHPFKGVHLLLDWFEVISGEFPSLTLLIRGRADDEGRSYWAALQPRVERLMSAGRCRVEGWRSADADPYADIDLLVAPSATPEVGPRVIMEAMLRAIPAIGYPTGGALSMISSPLIGAHAADEREFRCALHRLLDPERYMQVSAAALAHARSAFGVERFWRDLRHAYSAAETRRGSSLANSPAGAGSM